MSKAIKQGMDTVKAICEITGHNIPGLDMLAQFMQEHNNNYLCEKLRKFCATAELDPEFIVEVVKNEDQASCLFAAIDTTLHSHSKLGLIALALIYKNHWNNPDFLIPATTAFYKVSNVTLIAFIELYEGIDQDKGYLELLVKVDGVRQFHPKYNEAVELIRRNFFVQTICASNYENAPMQGMKWDHTEKYYDYCVLAKSYYPSDHE